MIAAVSEKKRLQIAKDMFFRYTGSSSQSVGSYILLTNFSAYLESFATERKLVIQEGSVLRMATDVKASVSMIQFHIGAPTAALLMDLLSAIHPKAVLMLGLCGGLHRTLKVGDFILPLAAIRNEGVSKHYLPEEVPSLPTFKLQNFLAETLMREKVPYKTGVIHSTDYRFWEFDTPFRKKLKEQKALAIEMECSALFTVGFKRKVPIGALLLVSDLPLEEEGIKTTALQERVFKKFLPNHIRLGLQTFTQLKAIKNPIDLRHFQW